MPFPPLINVQEHEAEATLLASSWLRYNGVLLTEILTESYESQEVRSEDGSQKLATHHIIKVMGVLNAQINAFDTTQGLAYRSPTNAPYSIPIIRDQMLKDRGFLQYAVGGRVVVESPAEHLPGNRFTTDSFQGPKPLYVQITQITGTATCYVRFAIECWTDPCAFDGEKLWQVQSHRFSMAHDVDGDTWLTTRMVTGHLKFRPEALANLNAVPDQVLKPNFFHPIPPGFKRQNVKVQAHPNGMELAYSFVDVEQVLPLGSLSPAAKLSAEFSLASSMVEGKPALTQAAVHVSAVGPKNQFRMNLLIMAIKIALRKLQKPGLHLVNEIMVTYSLDNRLVDLSMKALWKPVGIGMEGLQLGDTGLKADHDLGDLDAALLDYRDAGAGEAAQGSQPHLAKHPQSSFDGRKGTYLGLVIGSALVNGCFILTQPDNWTLAVENDKVAEFEPDPDQELLNPLDLHGALIPFDLEVTPALTITLLITGLSTAVTGALGFYEDWSMNTRYHTRHNKAVLPIGRAVTASPGDDFGVYTSPQVASLGLPYTLKVVDWSVAFIGESPEHITLPSPDTGDTNDVFLEEHITPAVATVMNATNKSWRVSGTFWYLSKRLRTSSATVIANYPSLGADQGFSPGKSITDPYNRQVNTIGQSRFTAGYSPSFVG